MGFYVLAFAASAPVPGSSTKQAKPKPGLPGLTPVKKAASGTPTGTSTPFASYRLKYQSSFCPTASEADKQTLPCSLWSISKSMKTASEEQKKELMAKRAALYKAASSGKTEEEKKKATADAKALYSRMYAMYCTAEKASTDPACTNELMKRMYGSKKK